MNMTSSNADEIVFEAEGDLLTDFLSWTGDAVVEMRELVGAMPPQIIRDNEAVCRIYDLTHNIKGLGASFDFQLMTDVGVSLCGFLKGQSDDTLISQRIFEAHVRAFEVIMQHQIKGTGGEQGPALLERLKAIIAEETLS